MSKFIVITHDNIIIEIRGEYIREQNMEIFKSAIDVEILNVKFYPNFQSLEAAKDYLISYRIQKLKEISNNLKEVIDEYNGAVELLENAANPEVKVLE